jgi:hypothetical protein
MTVANTIETKNYMLEVVYDYSPENPREWDNLGTIVAWHGRYNLSDENYSDIRTFLEEKTFHHFQTQEGLENATDERLWVLFEKEYVWLPVYMYEHGNIALSTESFIGRALHAEWDSGQVGIVFVSKEKIRKEYGVKRVTKKILETVFKVLRAEVEIYSNYLDGNVYGFKLYKKDGEELLDEDSCFGFYGDDFVNNGMEYYMPKEFLEELKQEGLSLDRI